MNSQRVDAEPTILAQINEGVMTIALNRPASLNAISGDLLVEFNAALDRVVEDPDIRCVVLTGNGRAFCAGGDISAHLDRPPDAEPYDLGDVLHRHFNPLLLRILRLPVPIVVAVNGAAAGAGCPLALAGDVVLAARSATFECGFARIGLMPDLGATWMIPRLVGRARAHAIMMLDERVTADQAVQWGLIYRVVEDIDLLNDAHLVARKLGAGPPKALVATRKAILSASVGSLADALDMEAESQRDLGYSRDFQEGIAAFFSRRRPSFMRDHRHSEIEARPIPLMPTALDSDSR